MKRETTPTKIVVGLLGIWIGLALILIGYGHWTAAFLFIGVIIGSLFGGLLGWTQGVADAYWRLHTDEYGDDEDDEDEEEEI